MLSAVGIKVPIHTISEGPHGYGCLMPLLAEKRRKKTRHVYSTVCPVVLNGAWVWRLDPPPLSFWNWWWRYVFMKKDTFVNHKMIHSGLSTYSMCRDSQKHSGISWGKKTAPSGHTVDQALYLSGRLSTYLITYSQPLLKAALNQSVCKVLCSVIRLSSKS